MSSALDYLCTKDIVHNDIKPANILYDKRRGAVLIDFGLASFNGRACPGGTPWYVPLEFMTEGKRSFASDVFALGVTMLYLVKKTVLPELQGPAWVIANARGGAEDGDRMEAWLGKLYIV